MQDAYYSEKKPKWKWFSNNYRYCSNKEHPRTLTIPFTKNCKFYRQMSIIIDNYNLKNSSLILIALFSIFTASIFLIYKHESLNNVELNEKVEIYFIESAYFRRKIVSHKKMPLQYTTTMVIIFREFLMFYQIFLSPQVKRNQIISYKLV